MDKNEMEESSVQYRVYKNYIILLCLLSLFCVLGIGNCLEKSRSFELGKQALSDAEYRRGFFSEEMWKNVDELSPECKTLLKNVENEAVYFPIPDSTVDKSLKISYTDSWMSERSYGDIGP